MKKANNQYYYSPSDLTLYMSSPFASWMERYAEEFPKNLPERDPKDELMTSLQNRGYKHEDELEEELKKDKKVLKIENGSYLEKEQQTIKAMQDGFDVIIQARLTMQINGANFGGYADFLVKVNHEKGEKNSIFGAYHYEVWDTKLANSVKPSFVMQLCCYAEMLEQIQGIRPEKISVVLGNKTQVDYKTNEFYYFYQNLKKTFLEVQNNFDANKQPNPANSKSHGNWSNYASDILAENDHLSLVATITKGQIKKLNLAGVHTVEDLANLTEFTKKGISPIIAKRLQKQAELQVKSRDLTKPLYKVLTPEPNEKTGLAILPPHSNLDVFFDIEGFSLDQGGLEYLWGNTYFNEKGERAFIDFWAHNRKEEKQAFIDFIQWVYARWKKDPSMHIYHYANYEIAACKRLMGRFGVCEKEVDDLLRNDVFVDLYKVVKGGLQIGTPNYSIKSVELLYRGKRDTEVANGGDSMVVYENWRNAYANGEEGNTWQTSKILNDIRDYNIDDCDSTQELVDWLRLEQKKHNIAFVGKTEVEEFEEKEEVTAVIELRDELLQKAVKETDETVANLFENLAWVLEFHRRENKVMYWRLFERLASEDEALFDDYDCLAMCERTEKEAFKQTSKARNLVYEYQFDKSQNFKGKASKFYIKDVKDEKGNSPKVELVHEFSDLENGIIALKSKTAPLDFVTLIPDELVSAKIIEKAIFEIIEQFNDGILTTPNAIIDFLKKSKPRIKNHNGDKIVNTRNPQQRLQQIIEVVKNLDHSYLTIQGPPGAGKTFTGKQIIAELVKNGAKVGISSNSHKAINNLLLGTAKFCKENNITAYFGCGKYTDDELEKFGVNELKSNQLHMQTNSACVLGTTAWGFSREDIQGKLDYLFIDEAGQVSIANLIAMSRSAKNIILMGDQMQLGQPIQGSHPAESGLSVLDYLLGSNPTIPEDKGVFLGTTYRMHAKVNQFISEHIYEGKLGSNPSNDKRIIEVPNHYKGLLNKEAGIIFTPIIHEGNTQYAPEEINEIKKMVAELLGRTLHLTNGTTRKVTLNDMLFVAPYNYQVTKLQEALGINAKVGTIDKFQGQEAPIVFLSMCASDANDSPRGIDFLFDKNRMNVAISRAQSLAIVVGNPNLGRLNASNVEQLRLANLYNAIVLGG